MTPDPDFPPPDPDTAFGAIERPICEPVEVGPGRRILLDRVRHDADSAASTAFPHFHDVHEVVLFGQVDGWIFAGDRRWEIRPGCVVSVPSMTTHDYALAPGARDWLLLRIDAASAAELCRRPRLQRLEEAFCALPDPEQGERLAMLGDWLLGRPPDDPAIPSLVELVLRLAVEAQPLPAQPMRRRANGLERLRPAVERLRAQPADPPGVEAAAALCALSPAWFSRRFKHLLGLSWSEYVRQHRLRLASQRLLDGDESVAAIAGELGFSSPSHFGELFGQRFGMPPAAYRRRSAGSSRGGS